MPGVLKRFISGEVIIAEGTVGNSVYIVQSGRVEVFKNSPNGPVQLAKLGPNEVFGEMSLIDERFSRRTASVRAIEDCEIIILDRKGFDGYLQQASSGVFNLIKRLATRLRETNDLISRAGVDLHNLPKTIKLATPTEGTGKLTDDELAESVDAAVDLNLLPRKFKKDQILVKEGAEAMSLFLLKSGSVRVFKRTGNGEMAVDDLCANEVFGEISMFDDGIRFFSVKSLEDGEAVVFSKKQMDEMLRKAPLELFLVLECITQKLKRTSLRFIEQYEETQKMKTELGKLTSQLKQLETETGSLRKKVVEQEARIKKLSPPPAPAPPARD